MRDIRQAAMDQQLHIPLADTVRPRRLAVMAPLRAVMDPHLQRVDMARPRRQAATVNNTLHTRKKQERE